MKKTLNKISIYFKKLLSIINKPEMKILPGQLAFFLVMSVFPILTLIGLVATSFNISMDTLIEFMRKVMPLEVSETLIPFIQGNGIDLKIGFSMIIGFIIASNHVNSSDQWLIGNKLGNRAICGFAASTIKNTFRGRIFELVKGAVFIDRNDKLSKSNGEEELAKRIAHDQIALIFPEGTRKNKTEEGRKKE